MPVLLFFWRVILSQNRLKVKDLMPLPARVDHCEKCGFKCARDLNADFNFSGNGRDSALVQRLWWIAECRHLRLGNTEENIEPIQLCLDHGDFG